jgi:hypothetical protein
MQLKSIYNKDDAKMNNDIMNYKESKEIYAKIVKLISSRKTALTYAVKLSILLDTITTKKRAVHRFRAGGKSSHRRRRLALGRF